jgi:hypothetical protein
VIYVDVFNCHVALAVNLTSKQILSHMIRRINKAQDRNREREKLFLENLIRELSNWDENPYTGGLCIHHQGGITVTVRLNKGAFRKAVAILSHEMTHATQYILRQRRIPLNEDTEEIYAYLQDFLLRDALFQIYE